MIKKKVDMPKIQTKPVKFVYCFNTDSFWVLFDISFNKETNL